MRVKIDITATDESGQIDKWSIEMDTADEWVQDRMAQAGGNERLAAALAGVYNYDPFPPRQD